MGQINSPQSHIQPPQNPLIAMTNLSTSPLSVGSTPQQMLHKDNIEQRNSMSSGHTTQIVPNTNTVQNTSGTVETNSSIEPTTILSPKKVNIPKTSTDGNA